MLDHVDISFLIFKSVANLTQLSVFTRVLPSCSFFKKTIRNFVILFFSLPTLILLIAVHVKYKKKCIFTLQYCYLKVVPSQKKSFRDQS